MIQLMSLLLLAWIVDNLVNERTKKQVLQHEKIKF